MLLLPLVALMVQAVTGRWSIGLIVASGVAVNLAAIGKRYLIVVPSQTKGMLLPYTEGSYSPTVSELGVVLGLLALGALLIGLFMKVFPIMELPQDEGEEVETRA